VTVPPTIRAAAPAGLALAVAGVALLVSWSALPDRVALVHEPETGAVAFAASRVDLVLVVGVLLVGTLVAYLVCAAFLAWTPARHLLVPHAEHWKAPGRRPELRRRLAVWLARGFAVAWWSVAVELVVTMLAQRGGALATWWLPAAVSGLTVLLLLGGLVVAFTVGFAPDARPAPVRPGREARAAAALPAGAAGPGRQAGRGSAADSTTASPRSSRPGDAPGTRAAQPRAGGPASSAPPRPGAAPAAGADRPGPPRPYQPRPRAPRAPGSRPHQGGGSTRG